VNQWQARSWSLIRDVAITGSGLGVIWSQVLSLHPSGLLLGTGLALTVRALLPGGEQPEPSSSPE
jgi:hypothetical protein